MESAGAGRLAQVWELGAVPGHDLHHRRGGALPTTTLVDAGETVVGVASPVDDVAEQRRAEEALRARSRARRRRGSADVSFLGPGCSGALTHMMCTAPSRSWS